MQTKLVLIRFNTNYPLKSDKKWRIIVDGTQHLVDDFVLTSYCFSSVDNVTDDNGGTIIKYHVSTNAKSVDFYNEDGNLIANIQ